MSDNKPWLGFRAALIVAAALPSVAHAQHTEIGPRPYDALSWDQAELDPKRQPIPLDQWWTWISASDFPVESRGPQSVTRFRIRIAADGKIVACLSPRDSNLAIAKRACDLFRQRGHFRNASTFDGKPIEGEVEFRLLLGRLVETPAAPPPPGGWRVALPPPPPPSGPEVVKRHAKPVTEPLNFRGEIWGPPSRPASVKVAVSAEGVVTRCEVTYSTGTPQGDAALCEAVTQTRFIPAQNSDGAPLPQPELWIYLRVGN